MNWNYRVLSVSISSLHLSVSISISFYLDTILDTDKPDSQLATYCTFSVTLGPGPLGVTLRQEARQLEYSQPGIPPVFERIVYIDIKKADFSHGILGHHISECMLLSQNPAILQINDIPVVGLSLKRTAIILASAPRPLTLVLQVGIRNVPEGVSIPTSIRLNTVVKDMNEEVGIENEC